METRKVFLSVGRTSHPDQEAFVQAIERYMQMHGLIPQTVGRTYFSSKQPLTAVTELMQECVGTIILAYERMYLLHALEKRGSAQEKSWQEISLPTVWNQIEASIAYTLGHPLLVIVGNDIKSEGLLEHGYDWYVKWAEINSNIVADPEFIGIFADWKKRTEAYYEQKFGAGRGLAAPADSALGTSDRSRLSKLRQMLTSRFSQSDIEIITFDLGLEYSDLPGDEFRLKTFNLIREMDRRNRLNDLISLAQQHRPEIPWDI